MNNINAKPPVYDPAAVRPMREELTSIGFEEALTPQSVDEILSPENGGAVLFVINSVCGCAAGSARPGVALALQGNVIPDKLVSSFAGQERDAIDHLREKYLNSYPPSSPSIAFFKNGGLKFFMPRFEIEGRSPEEIATILNQVFEEHCAKPGPSVSQEIYSKLFKTGFSGSSVSLN